MRRVAVISASVGAGHDGAAGELGRRLREAGYEVDRHDFLDLLGERAGRALRRAYATELKVAPNSWGWLVGGLERRGRAAEMVAALMTRKARARTLDRTAGADVIVSTYHLASQVLGRLRQTGELPAPVATFLTDLSVHPLWVARGIDAHLALHEVAAVQARRHGGGRVEVCAPAVRPAFRPATDRQEAARTRARYGLPAGRLALVVAGSWGVGQVAEAAADLAATGMVTPVTVCGRNESLRDRLTRTRTGVALGWVDQMPELIRASDIVVQNAGGLTSLEAMAAGVPVITYRCLPGHGATNAAALHDAGLAPWIREPAGLTSALAGALDGEPGRRARAATAELFGAPSAIDSIVALAGALDSGALDGGTSAGAARPRAIPAARTGDVAAPEGAPSGLAPVGGRR